jgi:hypothetical protein
MPGHTYAARAKSVTASALPRRRCEELMVSCNNVCRFHGAITLQDDRSARRCGAVLALPGDLTIRDEPAGGRSPASRADTRALKLY